MTTAYLQRMLKSFPEWLERNTAELDESDIKRVTEHARLFINYILAKGVDVKLKDL